VSVPAASREAASKESREAVELLERLRLKLFDPPPATPEAEAAALLLYLGLPAKAIFGRVIEDLGQWVVWSWGPYTSKRALIPSSRAQRLSSLRDALKERHKNETALLRSLQMQTKKKGIWWYDVRLLWQAYLGQGPQAELERLKEQLMEERHPSSDDIQKASGTPGASTLPPPPRSSAEGELNQPCRRAKLEELVEAIEEKKKNSPAGTAEFCSTLISLLRQYTREQPEGGAEGFLAWLERRGWSRNSIRIVAYSLRAAGARDLKAPSISPAAREALTAGELKKLLKAARREGFCAYALTALLGLCGLKVAEALSLTRALCCLGGNNLDRLLIYIAVTLAIATVFFSISRLKPLVDYCSEARRLAGDMLTVYQSGGRMIGEYRLSSVLVNGSGIFAKNAVSVFKFLH